jgi:tetratricopeptide (TPR) repeat protein
MRSRALWFMTGVIGMSILLIGVYQLPPVKYRLGWRLDAAASVVRGWVFPGDTLPAPSGAEAAGALSFPTPTPSLPQPTPVLSPTPAPTPTPIPALVRLPSPAWEKQDWNNCGPATLAFGLRYYGWEGDQFAISDLLKPDRGDRNVNIDELAYFVRTRAGWLGAEYRVGGTIDQLRAFLAAGFPVIVEKGYVIESEGPDAGWAGHYLLLTGYDDAGETFVAQDSFIGPDQEVSYTVLEDGWQAFNRVYLIIYPVEQTATVLSLMGEDADAEHNRERALMESQAEVERDAQDAFAWFNLGTNYVYFERYGLAAQAYDQALMLGLPWRFTRYQFGPYIAYFHQGRFQDVIDLADATLRRTNKAEESMLWRGWALYRQGDTGGAIADFRAALMVNPNYQDALYAISFLGVSP